MVVRIFRMLWFLMLLGGVHLAETDVHAAIEVLMDKVARFESSAQEQAALIRQQQQTIEGLQSRVQELSNKQRIWEDTSEGKARRQVEGNVVAFSATLKAQAVSHIGVHQNIVFPDVITNIGNGYNYHQGVFVAPVAGLYMFTTTILSSKNSEFAAAIEVNGSDTVRMYERGTDNRHGSATQNVIVQLDKGDDVSVQSLSADHSYWGDMYSSFSGVLLHEYGTEIIG